MWLLPVTRRELVELITPRRDADVPGAVEEHRSTLDLVRSDSMVALWPERPSDFGRMPTAIVVPEGTKRDTLAWLSTYVRDLRPFTAYCRVVERSTAERFLRGPASPSLLAMEGMCAGLILGEALAHARGRASILDLPATAYSGTLSHAMARTLALTRGAVPIDEVVRLWAQSRELVGQNGTGISPGSIFSVWAIALGAQHQPAQSRTLFEPANLLIAAWSDAYSMGEIRDSVWHRLVDDFPDLEPMQKMVGIPREQRVQVVDSALRGLISSKRGDEELRSFLAGYFTSTLAPGTLDHADFLAPVAATLPAAYLWYGLFAGVNPRGDALPTGNPLARRIVRDLTLPDRVTDRPRCDVAFDELAMHGATENFLKQSVKGGRLEIDLLPGITTSVRWQTQDVGVQEELRRARDYEAQHLLMQLDDITLHARSIAERLRSVFNGTEEERPTTNKRKRGTKS
ncbi:hypothetical protein R5W23_003726 [Gemmata sp. JC673]|uniref:MmgE/PrpD family protein n=1 Tax=Gemmata algarum TaxID=2975278 RepID=A0ABU5F4Z7_9BACT|nr:hypothetical protein [Gemmata algarum]MDY3562264.1 hypothetical protein [Gemmata algarum]